MSVTGHLEVLVVQGLGLKDIETFGRMDPYCEISISGQKFKTKSKTDAGKSPKWNERFTFMNINPAYSTEMSITVWDHNVASSDKEIGSGRLSMSNAYAAGTSEQRVQLVTKKGKSAGEVALVITFRPFGQQQAAAGQPMMQPVQMMAPAGSGPVMYGAPAPAAPVYVQQAAPQYVAVPPAQYVQPQQYVAVQPGQPYVVAPQAPPPGTYYYQAPY